MQLQTVAAFLTDSCFSFSTTPSAAAIVVASAFAAAYLMYRRGESIMSIARKTATNPVGSLVSEVKNVI